MVLSQIGVTASGPIGDVITIDLAPGVIFKSSATVFLIERENTFSVPSGGAEENDCQPIAGVDGSHIEFQEEVFGEFSGVP